MNFQTGVTNLHFTKLKKEVSAINCEDTNYDSCFSSLSSISTEQSKNTKQHRDRRSFNGTKRILPNFFATEELVRQKQNQLSKKFDKKFAKSMSSICTYYGDNDDVESVTSLEVAEILAGAAEMQPFEDDYEPVKTDSFKSNEKKSKSIISTKSKYSTNAPSTYKPVNSTSSSCLSTIMANEGLTIHRILKLKHYNLVALTIIRVFKSLDKLKENLPFKIIEQNLCLEKVKSGIKAPIKMHKVTVIKSVCEDERFIYLDGPLRPQDILIEINGNLLLNNSLTDLSSFFNSKSPQINLVVARSKVNKA